MYLRKTMKHLHSEKMIVLLGKWIIAFLASMPVQAQVTEHFKLDDKLDEISGLEVLNDSTLIAFNDGGNKSEVYLLNLKGELLRTVDVLDTKNHDWEDIARDDYYIYIGDIGNNENKRDNLSIVKIKISDILTRDEVEVEEIEFKYAEQKEFPPDKDSLFYDAEGMVVYNDSIWIFTKDRSVPFKGISHVYKVPTKPGEYTVSCETRISVGEDGWWKDGITAADIYDDKLYLLTYNRYIVMESFRGEWIKVSEHVFPGITQRESIVVIDGRSIFIADEENPIVGEGVMYKIHL